jgi:hypothetical protein
MKLVNIALNYAYTCAEAEAILTASAPEVIPFLHKKDLKILTRKIASYNIHGLNIHSVHVPGVSCGYIWPRRSEFLYSGKIFSFHIMVSDPKAEKQKAVPRNVSLSYVLDMLNKQLMTQLGVQDYYRKQYEAWLSAYTAKSAGTNPVEGSK